LHETSRLQQYRNLHREWARPDFINLNPIQRGGILSEEARKALLEFGDGYSTCDWCPPKEARLDAIEKPPISSFYQDLAKFLGMDVARVVTRCREAKFIIFMTMTRPGDIVVVDSLAHYSTFLAAELAQLEVAEVPNSGPPEFRITPEDYRTVIERIIREKGRPPVLALLTHVDSHYGNLTDAKKVAEICHEFNVPLILNAAYTAGIMPVDGKTIGADFIVSSGHKSWAASAPTGILAMKEEFAERVLVRSKRYPNKELALLGCTVMGAPLLSLMASFPHVAERVKKWDEEIEKARYLVSVLEQIEGTRQLGIRPKQHTLIHVQSDGFWKVSQQHPRRGYFLYDELKQRRIVGIQPGLSKHFKLNTYGLSWEDVKYVGDAFLEIAKKYQLL
jgi:Sep-tRNA:Cys-tRNA synthetase